MRDKTKNGDNFQRQYTQILMTLEKTEEGQRFLGEFLKRNRMSNDNEYQASGTDHAPEPPYITQEIQEDITDTQNSEIVSASSHFALSDDQESLSQPATGENNKPPNPVTYALQELAASLQKAESASTRCEKLAEQIRELAKILDHRQIHPTASNLLRIQATELENITTVNRQSGWQIAKVLQVLQILETYVRRQSVARSS